MAQTRPERATVEALLKEDTRRKAYDIAGEAGLIEAMGYDKAIDYVKRVRRTMRQKGDLPITQHIYGTDEERLADITALFELRQGEMSQGAAYHMLLMNCYLRLRSPNDAIHMDAIDDTYRKNEALKEPLEMATAIRICEIALERYMWSIDEEKNAAARRKGLPQAGLSYTNESLIAKCEITDTELQHMRSIRRD